jgi:glycosyltransferase involved in cell wall biosynthesis
VPNKKVLLDLDDNIWDVSPYQDIYRWHGRQEVMHDGKWLWKDGEDDFNIRRNKRRLARDEELFRRADLITVSTPRLEKRLREFNKKVKVVYNALNFDNWKPVKMQKEKFRIGWSGGVSHYIDLMEIKDALTEILNEHKNVKFIIAGSTFDGFTKDMPKDQIEIQPWVDIEAHPFRTALMNLDLAVIPLAKNGFNECKSCIKFYEFASLGIPTIATKFPPYSDEMHRKALTNDFKAKIEHLLHSRIDREEIAEKALKWVRENRDIKKEAKKLYEYIV